MTPKPIDPAALAGATMAGAVASLLQRGPFGVMDMLVGIALLLILLGYDDPTGRTRGQSCAVAGVTGFAALVAIGFPAELIVQILGANQSAKEDSAVHPGVLLMIWVVATLITYGFDRKRAQRTAKATPA